MVACGRLFETLKDSSLQVTVWHQKKKATERSSKLASRFRQNGFKNSVFLSKKLKILCSLDHTILFKFQKHVVHIFSRNVWRDLTLPMSASTIVAEKSFNGNQRQCVFEKALTTFLETRLCD